MNTKIKIYWNQSSTLITPVSVNPKFINFSSLTSSPIPHPLVPSLDRKLLCYYSCHKTIQLEGIGGVTLQTASHEGMKDAVHRMQCLWVTSQGSVAVPHCLDDHIDMVVSPFSSFNLGM